MLPETGRRWRAATQEKGIGFSEDFDRSGCSRGGFFMGAGTQFLLQTERPGILKNQKAGSFRREEPAFIHSRPGYQACSFLRKNRAFASFRT